MGMYSKKLMGNNLIENNLGLKLQLILGTKDFIQNDNIGLINNDEKEDLKNEI